MLMSVYRHNDYDSEDLEEKLIKARYFHDLLHAVGRSHQIKLLLIIQGFIHDKKHPQSCRRNIRHILYIEFYRFNAVCLLVLRQKLRSGDGIHPTLDPSRKLTVLKLGLNTL